MKAATADMSFEGCGAPVKPAQDGHAPSSGLREERIMEICEAMIDICAAMFNVPSKELRQSGRSAIGVSRVRQIAMYVTHVSLGVSMQEVGRGFVRERTTVRHACHLVEDMRDDEQFDRAVAVMERVALAAFRHRINV